MSRKRVIECSIEQDLDYPEIENECGWRIENESSISSGSFFLALSARSAKTVTVPSFVPPL